ncbi:hypothetical protein SERLA73DRAFT_175692, partial [Serpula lacrymans var. lacrymans S7.3]
MSGVRLVEAEKVGVIESCGRLKGSTSNVKKIIMAAVLFDILKSPVFCSGERRRG